jgi:drug/metabolite transporter (DMT)-like permease
VVAAPVRLPPAEAAVWAQLLWVAFGGTALPFLVEMAALRRADPGRVGVVATAEPVVAATAAWLALGQGLRPVQIGGMALTVAGVAAVQLLTHSVAPDTVPVAT